MRSARVGVSVLAGAALVGAGGTVLLLTRGSLETATGVGFAGLASLGVVTAVLGVAVTWQVPRNSVGPLLACCGLLTTMLATREVYYRVWLDDRAAVPLDIRVVAWLDESAWWLLTVTALLLLVFPTGRLPGPRWRAVPAGLVGATAVVHVSGAFAAMPFTAPMEDLPRPYGGYPVAIEVLSNVAFAVMIVLILACGASVVARYRGASGVERAQLRWLAFAGVPLAAYPLIALAELVVTGRVDWVATAVAGLALFALPLSVTVAMLRHRLYDVDRALADTVSYAMVAAALVAAYAVAAQTLGLLLGRDSPAAAAGATALCAVLLAPLRTRLRRIVDRRLFPPRRAALQAVEELQQRIHREGAQPEELEQVLRVALRDDELRVGMLVPGESGFVDVRGSRLPDAGHTPVTLGDGQIGVLTASADTPAAVLRETAAAAAGLVEVIRLRAELARALREVEASRLRLVQVGDAERRRLERDLHDGAQQRLVALGMALRLAQRHLPDVDIGDVMDQAVAELATAVAELRQIAHGLRPTSLDDGLHAALAALTSKLPVPVVLDVQPAVIAEQLATTAYFVAAEAITNAAKYAQASNIKVQVTRSGAGVAIRVQDDGIGGAQARTGSGLSGLADRVAALGGSLLLSSPVGAGTTLEAVLPCES
ncbi:MAG: sensor histidine kinase [Nocardioides sp.]